MKRSFELIYKFPFRAGISDEGLVSASSPLLEASRTRKVLQLTRGQGACSSTRTMVGTKPLAYAI
jgi:hypothetical protein